MPIHRILAVQCAITLLLVAGIFYDRAGGISALLGAALCVGPNAASAAVLFRSHRARDLREEQRRLHVSWAVRWLLALIGFGLVMALYPGLRPLPLFAAYAVTLAAPLTVNWMSTRKVTRRFWPQAG